MCDKDCENKHESQPESKVNKVILKSLSSETIMSQIRHKKTKKLKSEFSEMEIAFPKALYTKRSFWKIGNKNEVNTYAFNQR